MINKVTILGAKESGVGAAILAKAKGMEVFVSDFGKIPEMYRSELDHRGIAYEEGGHTESKVLEADVIVKSPGVPDKAPMVQAIRKAGGRIVSEIEFGSWYTDAKIVGITGSNGKTTTTSLIYHTLSQSGMNVGLAGNIGKSFAWQVAENDFSHYVLEISSFQLDDIESFRPDISVLLNITPDHLDRYNYDVSQYAASKIRIIENQTENDHFIFCMDDPISVETKNKVDVRPKQYGFSLEHKPGATSWVENNTIHLEMDQDSMMLEYERMRLKGKHNLYNTMAAAIVTRILDIRKDAVRDSFSDFRNVEHRLEKVAMVGGIEFINDSKATNVNSAWYALESIDKSVVWIAGGVDKGNDYAILEGLVEEKVKAIVALGNDVRKIHEAFSKKVNLIINATSMAEAVQLSYHLADKGEAVLLSPACASFDLFDDYEDRGRQFKHYVKNL